MFVAEGRANRERRRDKLSRRHTVKRRIDANDAWLRKNNIRYEMVDTARIARREEESKDKREREE